MPFHAGAGVRPASVRKIGDGHLLLLVTRAEGFSARLDRGMRGE
jgi:hypothetical protein